MLFIYYYFFVLGCTKNAYSGHITYMNKNTSTVLLLIDSFCVLKLRAEKNHCPVLVYVTSSDNVCLMELKVPCKCVLCLKRTLNKFCVSSLLSNLHYKLFLGVFWRGGDHHDLLNLTHYVMLFL